MKKLPIYAKNVLSKLWVKFGQNNAVKVSTDGCVDIDDFIEAVKKK
jgi:hypothetical protein